MPVLVLEEGDEPGTTEAFSDLKFPAGMAHGAVYIRDPHQMRLEKALAATARESPGFVALVLS